MEWLNQILGVDTPGGTTLKEVPHLAFRGLFPWWVAILFLFVAAAGIVVLYLTESKRVNIFARGLMAMLRIAALVLLVLLLFRPTLQSEFEGKRPRSILLLLDNSQSMTQKDKRQTPADLLRVAIALDKVHPDIEFKNLSTNDVPDGTPKDASRLELVKGVLKNPKLKLHKELEKKGPVRPFLFGQESTGAVIESEGGEKKATLEDMLAQYDGREIRTAIGDVINNLLLKKDGELPAAIVLVTDGQDNASKVPLLDVAAECGKLKVPLHIYGVGSAEAGSLQIRDVAVADTLFFDDTVSVPIRFRSQGLKKGTIAITLKLGDKIVATKKMPVKSGEDLREVLSFAPKKEPGKKDDKAEFSARIELEGNKDFVETVTRQVRVIDSKVKLLYIENSPRWEYKHLQPALLRDRRVQADFLLVNADPKVLNSGPPFLPSFPKTKKELLQYDLIILGDVPSSYLGKERMEWLEEYVEKFRGGLICIAGAKNMPATYVNTPIEKMLPVDFQVRKFQIDGETRPEAYKPILTDVGLRTDMLTLAETQEENVKAWDQLESFFWFYPVEKLRPGAVSLLAHPKAKMGDMPMTIMASQFFGKGQVVYLGTEETWRWRKNTEDKVFGRFWGQLIYQMGLPHLLGNNSSRVQLALERSEAIMGRPGSIYARLLDQDFQPLKDKQVSAQLVYMEGKAGDNSQKIMLERIEGREGEYRAILPHDRQGRYEVRITQPELTTFPFRVNLPPRHELEESGLADEVLTEAARVSGGRFYQEEDLHKLAASVEQQLTTFSLRQEIILWNWLALVLFVLVVTSEWVLRKFANLS